MHSVSFALHTLLRYRWKTCKFKKKEVGDEKEINNRHILNMLIACTRNLLRFKLNSILKHCHIIKSKNWIVSIVTIGKGFWMLPSFMQRDLEWKWYTNMSTHHWKESKESSSLTSNKMIFHWFTMFHFHSNSFISNALFLKCQMMLELIKIIREKRPISKLCHNLSQNTGNSFSKIDSM